MMNLRSRIITITTLVVGFFLNACTSIGQDDQATLKPVKRAEVSYHSQLARLSHGSDGSDRARDGKPRFLGPLGARGVTYKGYQYIVYYTGKDRTLPEEEGAAKVIIARRNVEGGDWERSTLQGYKVTSDDAHNRQSIGISGDGVIHIAFDHHNDPVLNYAKTKSGFASNPADVVWDDTVFTYAPNFGQNILKSGTKVTYPNFNQVPGGGLILYFRHGGSYGGDMQLGRYDAEQSKWTFVRNISNRKGTYKGLETTRGPYTAGGMQVDKDGRLHVAWLFRERPCKGIKPNIHYERFCNHGLYYASSPDEGKTWYHVDGRLIADTSKGESLGIGNVTPEVVDIPKELGPSNVINTSTMDSQNGNMHVLVAHLPSAQSAKDKVYHYIGTPDGIWTSKASSFDASDAKLAIYGDYMFAFTGRSKAAIYYASRKDGFSKWTQIALGSKQKADKLNIEGGYITWDLSRMEADGIASAIWHMRPKSQRHGDASPIYVIDFKVMD